MSIPFRSLLQLLGQGHQVRLLCFIESFQFPPGMLIDQATLDQNKVMEWKVLGGTTMVDVDALLEAFQISVFFSSTAKALGFLEYQLPD
jgi:hypothetical protein